MRIHSKGYTDQLQVSRKGCRELASIEDFVDAAIHGFEEYPRKRKERIIASATIRNCNIKSNERTIKIRKHKCKEKQMY